MQVLLVFHKEDPQIITLKNAIITCGHTVKCSKNIEETHEAFKKTNYDLVFIDSRRKSPAYSKSHSIPQLPGSTGSGSIKANANSPTTSGPGLQYDYENICRFIRKLFHYTVIVAITPNYDDRDVPNILPLLEAGFNRTFTETTNLARCTNELLTLQYGEVSTVRRLQAAHALFTALEYSNDSIEILNDQFKIIYVNGAFEKLTGFALHEMSGQDFNLIHNLEGDQKINRKMSQGNVVTGELLFSKANGEIVYHPAVTLPVVVQGETNKIQNYVTIADVRSSVGGGISSSSSMATGESMATLSTMTSSMPSSELHAKIKKLPSVLFNKRGTDFDKFALMSAMSLSGGGGSGGGGIASDESSAGSGGGGNRPSMSPSAKISISISEDDASMAAIAALAKDVNKSNSVFDSMGSLDRSDSYHFLKYQQNLVDNSNKNLFERKRSYEVNSQDGKNMMPRRFSTARVFQHSSVEAPIRKVINMICMAHENSTTDAVRSSLDRALDILRSTELYSPSVANKDKHTTDLVSGLMSDGFQKNGKTELSLSKQHLSAITPSQSYVKNLPVEITNILDTEELWSFDIISLERLTDHRPLVTLGLKIMTRFNVCDHLKIDQGVLVNWLTLMESNYRRSNPYHNSTHASDVLHATAYFLSTEQLMKILEDNDRVASLIAAAIHDLNHPGRTNAFLCNSKNELAILYNDHAVLENHHAALAFKLTLQSDDVNIFQSLTRDEYRSMRSMVIDMVLATEMNKHFEHLNKFVNKFAMTDEEEGTPGSSENKDGDQENRTLIKRILIKCADVSNPCRPLDIYKEWVNRIAAEYFEQTDDEKRNSLPVVMPIFDRSSCNVPKTQISFIEYFIMDMFTALDDFIYIPEVTSNLQANLVFWRECAEDLELAEKSRKIEETRQINSSSIFEDNENENDSELE